MPLHVVVVGAGLGGLGSAIALNRAGHDVDVYEQSGFLNEVGAAIHVAPNATRILKGWDCDLTTLRAVECEYITRYDHNTNYINTAVNAVQLRAVTQNEEPWLLSHRVDLHNALRKLAEVKVNGKAPKIHLRKRVKSVDAEQGEIRFEDGTVVKGDLIIGADGIHSRSVFAVTGQQDPLKGTGQNIFRFLVRMDKINANPQTKEMMEKLGTTGVWSLMSRDRRILGYPCRNGTLLNVAGIFPADGTKPLEQSSWHAQGALSELLTTFEGFYPAALELCKMGEDIKLWELATRDPPKKYYKGKLALMGDAAHPFSPHLGQGGAQGFEDAAALGAIFDKDTRPEEVPKLLEVYNNVRYDRSLIITFNSRVPEEHRHTMLDELRKYVPNAEYMEDMWPYAWSSKPDLEAKRQLAAYKERSRI